jgi:hypothetical protein
MLESDIDAMEEDVVAACRPAAQAGAELLYHGVLRNLIGRHVTGKLAEAVYQAYAGHESTPERAVYEVSWNPRKAPHGHLVENGYIQKYAVFLGKDGKWHTNKKKPLKTPKQVAAVAFVRSAQSLFPLAQAAMEDKLLELLNDV